MGVGVLSDAPLSTLVEDVRRAASLSSSQIATAGYVGVALLGWLLVCLFQCVGGALDFVCTRGPALFARCRQRLARRGAVELVAVG